MKLIKIKFRYLHPNNIDAMLNIFSQFVVGLTLPKPTLVKLVNVKNNAVIYFDFRSGPEFSELLS
jgi:hypothetical protein